MANKADSLESVVIKGKKGRYRQMLERIISFLGENSSIQQFPINEVKRGLKKQGLKNPKLDEIENNLELLWTSQTGSGYILLLL